MTSEERVLAALNRSTPDRVPVFAFLNPLAPRWATGIQQSVNPDSAGYREVLDACLEYADLVQDWYFPGGFFNTNWDVRMTRQQLDPERIRMTAHTPTGELNCIIQDRPGGGTEKHWVESVEDAERLLSIPYVPARPPLDEFLSVRNHLRGRSIGQVTLGDPVSALGVIAPEVRSLWTIAERDLLIEMLDTAYERIMDQLDYLLDRGVGPLYYFNGPEYAIPPLMSPHDFDEFVVAYDEKLVAKVHEHGMLTQIHCHGRVNGFLEKFVDIGTDSLNPLEPPPLGDVVLADAKRRVGESLCLIGNIQYEDLASASLDEIEEMVRSAIEDGAPGGGFILCLCAAPYEIPLPPETAQKLIHYLRMANRYGGAPN